MGNRIAGHPIGDDLLYMYWRGELVDRKVPWIDDAHAACSPGRKPYLSIRGLRHMRPVPAKRTHAPDAVGAVEDRGLDDLLRIVRPFVQLRTRNSHEATRHVQPPRFVVIFYRPMNAIAR